MYTINVELECGCFKRSAYENNLSFESKDEALMEARLMESHMNQRFCQKHMFTLSEDGNNFNIAVEAKPRDTSGGCCGGGHCS